MRYCECASTLILGLFLQRGIFNFIEITLNPYCFGRIAIFTIVILLIHERFSIFSSSSTFFNQFGLNFDYFQRSFTTLVLFQGVCFVLFHLKDYSEWGSFLDFFPSIFAIRVYGRLIFYILFLYSPNLLKVLSEFSDGLRFIFIACKLYFVFFLFHPVLLLSYRSS